MVRMTSYFIRRTIWGQTLGSLSLVQMLFDDTPKPRVRVSGI
jgi:hypothetical protein